MQTTPRLDHGYTRRSLRAIAENFYRGIRHPGRDAAGALWLAAWARRRGNARGHAEAIRVLRTIRAQEPR